VCTESLIKLICIASIGYVSVFMYLKLSCRRFKVHAWQMPAAERGLPQWSAESMHWQLGKQETSAHANAFVFQAKTTATGTVYDAPSEITAGLANHQLSPPLPQVPVPQASIPQVPVPRAPIPQVPILPMAESDSKVSFSPLLDGPPYPKKSRTAETITSNKKSFEGEEAAKRISDVNCEYVFIREGAHYRCPHCTYISTRRWNCHMHVQKHGH
jgi:hypothetical protein